MLTRHDISTPLNRFEQGFGRSQAFLLRSDSLAANNSGLKKLATQWLNEVQFFNQTFVVTDSYRLRNRHLRQARKRHNMYENPIRINFFLAASSL